MATKKFVKEYLLSLLFILLLFFVWEFIIYMYNVPSYILPSPTEVIKTILDNVLYLLQNTGTTLFEIFVGFFLGMTFALAAAICFIYSSFFKKLFYPILIIFNVTPKLALIPLLILWLGNGLLPKIVITALISFFPVLINTYTGLNSLSKNTINLMKSINATKTQLLLKARIPTAIPYFFTGLRISITLSIVGAIMGEFIGANSGLGYVILISDISFETNLMFAALFIIGLMGIILFFLIRFIEKKVVFWVNK